MYIDTKGTRCMYNSIVVVNHLAVKRENRHLDPNAYFRECERFGVKNIGVFHTGDLDFKQDYGYYKKVRPPRVVLSPCGCTLSMGTETCTLLVRFCRRPHSSIEITTPTSSS